MTVTYQLESNRQNGEFAPALIRTKVPPVPDSAMESALRTVAVVSCLVCSAVAEYHVTTTRDRLDTVREECKLLGGDLVTINNGDENSAVTAAVQEHVRSIGWNKNRGPDYLIGLHVPDENNNTVYGGQFAWFDGSTYSNESYSNWWGDRWTKPKDICDPPHGYPYTECFIESHANQKWRCAPDCAFQDLLVTIRHGLQWNVSQADGPPGGWAQFDKSKKAYGVCDIPDDGVVRDVNDPSFKFFLTPTLPSYADITKWCEENNGTLASIRNERENFELGKLLDAFDWDSTGSKAQVFIGLQYDQDEQDWFWVDGSPSTFVNWKTNEPNNPAKQRWVEVFQGYGDIDGFVRWGSATLSRERNGKPINGVCKRRVPSPPAIPFYGYSRISVAPDTPVGGLEQQMTVMVENPGGANEEEPVRVRLLQSEWGISFGAWEEVGQVELPTIYSGQTLPVGFPLQPESEGIRVFQAEVSYVDDNLRPLLDRSQISARLIRCGDGACSFDVPFINGRNVDVELSNLEIACLPRLNAPVPMPAGLSAYPCPTDESGQSVVRLSVENSDLDANSTVVVPAMEQLLARVTVEWSFDDGHALDSSRRSISGDGAGGRVVAVVVQATDALTGEVSHVVAEVEASSVSAVLNAPHVCCVGRLETRVLLDELLADALDAFERAQCHSTQKLLRLFTQKVALLECDLAPAERVCLRRAARAVVDAARMVATECRHRDDTRHDVAAAMEEGDAFVRLGLLEAAVLQYSQATAQSAAG